MAISLTSIIAAIEAKAAAATSSTSISDLYKIVIEANKVGGATVVYDSAGVFPIDSAHVGSTLSTTAGGLYVLDSVGGSWQSIVGSAPPAGWTFQGSNYGYAITNYGADRIERYSFASDGNGTGDIGNTTLRRGNSSGQMSAEYAYVSGGSQAAVYDVIDKFPFAVSTGITATDVGNLTQARANPSGSSSDTYGYAAGGFKSGASLSCVIDKFPTSVDADATNVGNLVVNKHYVAGQSSTTYGYTSGGQSTPSSPTYYNTIEKFSFSADGNATDVGDLTVARGLTPGGQSSTTHGYTTGGIDASYYYNIIDKFSFVSDGNATDVGDMVVGAYGQQTSGTSSTTHGYGAGGYNLAVAPTTTFNVIEKFSFSTDGNSTDVGDLGSVQYNVTGVQF